MDDKVNRVLLKKTLEMDEKLKDILEGVNKLNIMVETEQANRILMEDPVVTMIPCETEAELLAFLEVIVNSVESCLLMVIF